MTDKTLADMRWHAANLKRGYKAAPGCERVLDAAADRIEALEASEQWARDWMSDAETELVARAKEIDRLRALIDGRLWRCSGCGATVGFSSAPPKDG